jgi:hypothetical protein
MDKNKWSQSQTANYFSGKWKFKVHQPAIHRIVAAEAELRAKVAGNPLVGKAKCIKATMYPELKEILVTWFKPLKGKGGEKSDDIEGEVRNSEPIELSDTDTEMDEA